MRVFLSYCIGRPVFYVNDIVDPLIVLLFQSLLDEPNPNSPANSLAAQLYQENRREYEKRVEAIVEQSWHNFTDEEDPANAKKEPPTAATAHGSGTSNS